MPTFVIGEFVYISLAILLLAHAVRQVCHLPAVKNDTTNSIHMGFAGNNNVFKHVAGEMPRHDLDSIYSIWNC